MSLAWEGLQIGLWWAGVVIGFFGPLFCIGAVAFWAWGKFGE